MVRHTPKIGLKLFREKTERFVTGQQQGQDRLLKTPPFYVTKKPATGNSRGGL